MLRYHSMYAAHCGFREITPQLLVGLLDALKVGCPALRIGCIEVKFIASANRDTLYNTNLKTLGTIWETAKPLLRSYTAYFSTCNMKGDARVEHVYLYLSLSLRDKAGKPTLGLALGAGGCYPTTFSQFVDTARAILGVEVIPPPGSSWDRERLAARWQKQHIDADLVSQVSGAIDAHQFDTAIKAAVGVVETRLRQRCVASGRADAASQTGADLAVTAYHKDKGCLTPPWPLATEACHGAQLLFQGFFLYVRNAYMHNTVVMGKDEAGVYDTLSFCEYLLKVIDKSEKR